MIKFDLGFIGCGNMARAIIKGLQANGSTLRLAATDTNLDATSMLAGVTPMTTSVELASSCRYILVAVKPAQATEVFEAIKNHVTAETCVISIMAGYKIANIAAALPTVTKIARVMPNLAAQQLSAMSAVAYSDGMAQENRDFTLAVMKAVGETVIVQESDLDAVTAVSGSGTAYVYEFIQHFIAGGVNCGLTEETAQILALQTIRGAVKMVEHRISPIEPMIEAVCSKGGTTIEAVKTLRAEGFGDAIEHAVKACYDRSVAMGKNS